MTDSRQFDDIRPYEKGEIKEALRTLLADRRFRSVLHYQVPFLPVSLVTGLLRLFTLGVDSPLQLQKRLMLPIVRYVRWRSTDGNKLIGSPLPPRDGHYLFLSNHRDIVLDSAFLSALLIENDYDTTTEIGIGDNLLVHPWIRTLVRANKAFLVRRSLSPREMFKSSKHMSAYIHYAITCKHENVWLAQREGRAKDSDDRTQPSVLKMLAMGAAEGVKSIEHLRQLHIVPLTISYEYDPCDYLKAAEFQLKRDNPAWKKTGKDDLTSMADGINGQKGRVTYRTAPCINEWIDEYADLPHGTFYEAVARRIDRDIHQGYTLYPGNYVASDLLTAEEAAGGQGYGISFADKYTPAEARHFEDYIASRLALIDIPDKDETFLRRCLLTMYANPARNHQAASLPC